MLQAMLNAMHGAMQIKTNSYNKKKIDNALTAERLARSVSPHEKPSSAEKQFLAELLETFGRWNPKFAKAELANWGRWWWTRFRTCPDKTRWVLADICSMIREGKITEDPGKAA